MHRRTRSIHAGAALALAFTLLAENPVAAQSAKWPSVTQTNGWYANVYEKAIDSTFSFMSDIQWRRAGFVYLPKQLDAVAGIGKRVAPGLRLTLGGGYVASEPYGLLPAPYPTREYQLWYQAQFAQRAGAFEISNRFRYDNRWAHDIISDDTGTHDSAIRFSHRVRYQIRASHAIGSVKFHARPVLAIAANEAFLGLTPVDRGVSFDQNRASIGVGIPLTQKERLEVSYMQQWIANARLKTNEYNNTLLVLFNHPLPIR